ncbi:hypothetical protein GCM10009535_45070 [Streptomyces thermocarboxydovorans]|uniref:Uncharacterized protein n=1 Tax=Streptomyces thermocarboxydovorans TaxID=59298 RepID=A0ABP3SRR4_9ACTN
MVAVRREISARGAVSRVPTTVPATTELTEAHQPRPKDGGSQPKTITPRQRLEPSRIDTRSRGPLVRSSSGMVSTPRCSIGMAGLLRRSPHCRGRMFERRSM